MRPQSMIHKMVRTLLVDNYDSFTFNLFQLLAKVNGVEPIVICNDQLDREAIEWEAFDNVVLSPGPGTPLCGTDIGLCADIIEHAPVPVLGVCLGHEAIGHIFGAKVVHAPEVMHGRYSAVRHLGIDLFQGIPQDLVVVRYHSLALADLPHCLEKVAWTHDDVTMGIRHRSRPLWGVQFHPESIGTEFGAALPENFGRLTRHWREQPKTAPRTPVSIIPRRGPPPAPSHAWRLRFRRLDLFPDPETIFTNTVADLPYGYWLDSSLEAPDRARFSFIGGATNPALRLEYRVEGKRLRIVDDAGDRVISEDIFEFLGRWLDEHRTGADELPFDFTGGLVGYFGYGLKSDCRGEVRSARQSTHPDAQWFLADRLIALDHLKRCTYLVSVGADPVEADRWLDEMSARLVNLTPARPVQPMGVDQSLRFVLSRDRETYLDDIARTFELIHAGETYEVCLTNQLRADVRIDPVSFYRVLRQVNPAPYSAFLRFGELAVACSSPERFLRIEANGAVESKPIKGTVPRGKTADHDRWLREGLASSEKDRAENLMIVDLLRNDLGLVCDIGTVCVPKLMHVESYATVHQLVSTIRGQLRSDVRAIDCVRAAFPGGSMTGAPKIRTMEIIDRLEQNPRGIYSGAIGYLGLSGAADLNIVIRTAIITPDELSIGIGGAIVALSDPDSEFDEILLKARALVKAASLTLYGEERANLFSAVDRGREPTRARPGPVRSLASSDMYMGQ